MSKPKPASEHKTPSYPATPAYKQWVWNQLRKQKWTLDRLVDETKKADRAQSGGAITATTSSSTLSQFLGAKDAAESERLASNTELMPALNKALGIAPPPVCDPSSPLSQLKDRLDHLWRTATPDERERFLRAIEATIGLAEKS